jgi:hypothetical protein
MTDFIDGDAGNQSNQYNSGGFDIVYIIFFIIVLLSIAFVWYQDNNHFNDIKTLISKSQIDYTYFNKFDNRTLNNIFNSFENCTNCTYMNQTNLNYYNDTYLNESFFNYTVINNSYFNVTNITNIKNNFTNFTTIVMSNNSTSDDVQ